MSTTYGDLLGAATVAMVAGNQDVWRGGRFADAVEARNAVGAWYDLFLALRSHTWTLLDPQHLRIHLLTGEPDAEPHLDVSAVHTFKAIARLYPRTGQTPYPDAGFAHPWINAAKHLRAAEDLLATHFTPGGGALSQFADQIADPAARRTALVAVTHLTEHLLYMEKMLGLRCAEARVPWAQVQTWFPDHARARELARRAHQLAKDQAAGAGLDDVPINYHDVRTDSPLDELTDRMARLTHAAWSLTAHPDYSIATLRDLAALGLAVHAHTASAAGADLTTRPAPDNSPTLAAARAWHQLADDLRHYRASGPADPQVRTDALAVGELLERVAPLWHPNPTAKITDPITRHLTSTLNGACHAMTQIADWNATHFRRLANSGLIWIRAGDLPRDVVSESDALASARLAGRIIPVPPQRAAMTAERYAVIAELSAPPHMALPPTANATMSSVDAIVLQRA